MHHLLASKVFSSGDILRLLFVYIGLPAILLIGAVILMIWAVRQRQQDDRHDESDKQ